MRIVSSWWVRRFCRRRALTEISVCCFVKVARFNLRPYSRCFSFWLPVLKARAERHHVSAADLLLNPIFRWAFLYRTDRLRLLEQQLASLEVALGAAGLRAFRDQLLNDVISHPVENDAHNRLLSAMVEARAILRFSAEKYSVTLIPRSLGHRTPDFRAHKGSEASLVEAKYVRPPDKLEEYLLRWWQAQADVAGQIPLGLLPHLRFECQPVYDRTDLSVGEIELLKDFFVAVLKMPERPRDLASGRLLARYIPDRTLPIAPAPLSVKAAHSEADREGLFTKLRRDMEQASAQLAAHANGEDRTIFLALNLSPDIGFLWPDRFNERLEALRREYVANGVEVLVEEVGYL